MKKITTVILAFGLIFSSNLKAEATEVPKAAKESSELYEKSNWRPWAVGIITILIAATGITLVAANK